MVSHKICFCSNFFLFLFLNFSVLDTSHFRSQSLLVFFTFILPLLYHWRTPSVDMYLLLIPRRLESTLNVTVSSFCFGNPKQAVFWKFWTHLRHMTDLHISAHQSRVDSHSNFLQWNVGEWPGASCFENVNVSYQWRRSFWWNGYREDNAGPVKSFCNFLCTAKSLADWKTFICDKAAAVPFVYGVNDLQFSFEWKKRSFHSLRTRQALHRLRPLCYLIPLESWAWWWVTRSRELAFCVFNRYTCRSGLAMGDEKVTSTGWEIKTANDMKCQSRVNVVQRSPTLLSGGLEQYRRLYTVVTEQKDDRRQISATKSGTDE